MSVQTRTFAAMLVVTAIAAGLAGWIGVQYGIHKSQTDLDVLIHSRLHLTPPEELQIHSLEVAFAKRRTESQVEMDAANRDLADAITRDHVFGPAEEHAVNRFHVAMMALQEDTIRHVLAMRAVLSPQQARVFDELVAQDLTQTSP
jgi:hypothetical protein